MRSASHPTFCHPSVSISDVRAVSCVSRLFLSGNGSVLLGGIYQQLNMDLASLQGPPVMQTEVLYINIPK